MGDPDTTTTNNNNTNTDLPYTDVPISSGNAVMATPIYSNKAIIFILKNLLNEFINVEAFTIFINIIIDDLDKFIFIKEPKTESGKLIKNMFDEIKKIEQQQYNIDNSDKREYLTIINIIEYYTNFIKGLKSDIDPSTKNISEQKITSIKYNDIFSNYASEFSETKENNKDYIINKSDVINKTKRMINFYTINKIIRIIPSNDMKLILNTDSTSMLKKLYFISQISYIFFRLYPLILYILIAEDIYGVQDVIIRISMLKHVQFQIRSMLNTLKRKIVSLNMEDTIVPVPIDTIQPKKIIQLIDDFIYNTFIPNNFINLFKVKEIINLFEITQIEYFTQNNNNKVLQKQDDNKKYFMICIVILLAVLFFKFFIKK
jgi:hypothetical protein